MTTVYHNPRCSKSREALKLVQSLTNEVEVVEYLKTPLDFTTLQNIVNQLGISPADLLRKKEADYKAHVKDKNLTDDELIQAMIDYPKLMERPIVMKNNKAVIARPAELVKKILE